MALQPFSSWWRPASDDLNLHCCIIYLDDIIIFSKWSGQPSWEAGDHVPETGTGWAKTQTIQVWAVLMADYLLGAYCLCPRNSHQWQQIRSKLVNGLPQLMLLRSMNFSRIYSILQMVHSKGHADSSTPYMSWASGENAGKKKVAILWDDRCQWSFDNLMHLCTHSAYSCLCRFHQTF